MVRIFIQLVGQVIRVIVLHIKGVAHPALAGEGKQALVQQEALGCKGTVGRVAVHDAAADHGPEELEQLLHLQPGEAGIIRLSLDTDRLSSLGLTQTSVYLSRFMGDKVEEDNELPLSAILLPDFSRLSDEEIRQAPSIRLSAYQVDLLSALEKKKRVHADVIITNEGKSALSICKVQTFSPSVGIHLKNSIVQPGASTRLRVILTRRNMRKHNQCLRMLLITNDPVQPKVQIDIR